MPFVNIQRIPLPSIKTYACVTAVLFSVSVYYASVFSRYPDWKLNSTKLEVEFGEHENNTRETIYSSWVNYENETFYYKAKETARFMVQEPLCVWSAVNMVFSCLLVLGSFIQRIVFGEMRVSEEQHINDKIWNFVFYKLLFVFGIVNVQFLHEVVFWSSWFFVLGFLNFFTHLGKDRFEYLSFSTTTSNWNHFRLLGLLVGIFIFSGLMLLLCIAVGFYAGFNTFAFMAAECIQLNIRTLHTILSYFLYLYDTREGDGYATASWEKRGPFAYYAELIFELTILLLDFVHHLHMLLWSDIFLSVYSLVIWMQLRHLFHEIQKRIKKHRNYLWVLNHMEQNYPMATPEELAAHKDNCAICWEEMESARKLPCTHLFHNACLQSWLEQDTSCPTCRLLLSIRRRSTLDVVNRLENGDNQQGNRRFNHFFHFDGSRYVSWLPSFSVEVTHAQLNASELPAIQTSQFDAMARQVQQLFPHIPLSVVINDLRLSRSVELTIENILDGRVTVPAHMFRRNSAPSPAVSTERQVDTVAKNGRENHPFWNDNSSLERNPEKEENVVATFSKSSVEREKSLQKRKEQLILSARRKYLEKLKKGESSSATPRS